MNLKEQTLSALEKNNISPNDVLFVSYTIGPDLQSRNHYSCNLDSFLKIANGVQSGFELTWIYEIKIVGYNFWFDFDSRGDWVLHRHPLTPGPYRRPSREELVRVHLPNDVE